MIFPAPEEVETNLWDSNPFFLFPSRPLDGGHSGRKHTTYIRYPIKLSHTRICLALLRTYVGEGKLDLEDNCTRPRGKSIRASYACLWIFTLIGKGSLCLILKGFLLWPDYRNKPSQWCTFEKKKWVFIGKFLANLDNHARRYVVIIFSKSEKVKNFHYLLRNRSGCCCFQLFCPFYKINQSRTLLETSPS